VILRASWPAIFEREQSRKVILVTLLFGWLDPFRPPRRHIALEPGALRFSTHPDTVVTESATSRKVPFWPWILEWPEIEYRMEPADHRAEIAETTVRLAAGAKIGLELPFQGGLQAALARIDLWSDGVTFDGLIRLLQGPVRNAALDARTGGVQLSISDGAPEREVRFPDVLTREDFHDASEEVIGFAGRQFILGDVVEDLPAIPIDGRDDPRGVKRFYVGEPAPFQQNPTQWFKGGRAIAPPKVYTATMPASLVDYVEAEFEQPVIDLIGGLSGDITFTGARGTTELHPILFLLDAGNYEVSPAGRQLLRGLGVVNIEELNAVINSPAPILDLVFNRLVPQTSLVGTFRQGQVHFFKLFSDGPQVSLGIGTGLRYRLREAINETPLDNVFNVFEIRCGRTQLGGEQDDLNPLFRILRTPTDPNTPKAMRGLLSQSQQAYGVRAHPPVDAGDLVVLFDEDGVPTGSPAGEALADLLVKLNAHVHRSYRYAATWLRGMALDLNWRVLLTDADEGATDLPTRVVGWRLAATGPVLTLQTEDATAK